MTRFTIALSFIIVLAASLRATGEVGPDLYQSAGQYSFQPVSAAAGTGDYLYLLLDGSIGIVDLGSPGLRLPVELSVTLDGSYRNCVRQGDWLYCYDNGGALAVAHLFGNRAVVVNETALEDSLFALVSNGRYLYQAAGYSGIRIIDAGDRRHLRLVGTANHGVYYSQLAMDGDMLYAVDDRNGIDVYKMSGAALDYQQTLATGKPPRGIVAVSGALHAWFDDRSLQSFADGDGDILVPTTLQRFSTNLTAVAGVGDKLAIALQNGVLALYSTSAAMIVDSLQLPFPVAHLVALQSGLERSEIAVVDVVGGVQLLEVSGSELHRRRGIDLPSCFIAQATLDSQLVALSSNGGIDSYYLRYSQIARLPLFPSAPIYQALVACDDLLFAAEDRQNILAVYDFSRPGSLPLATFGKSQPTSKLFCSARANGTYRLVSIGDGGAEAFSYSAATGFFDLSWTLDFDRQVVTGFVDDSIIGLVSSRDTLFLFDDSGLHDSLQLRQVMPSPESTSAVTILEDKYLVIGGGQSTIVGQLSPDLRDFELLKELTTVRGAIDFAFDSENRILLAACGEQGIRYFDFSEPGAISAVFPILYSEGISHLTLAEGMLYATSSQALTAWRRTDPNGPPITIPEQYTISYNYPNPFNGQTRIEVTAAGGEILGEPLLFEVYNILGQLVRHDRITPHGSRLLVSWDGRTDDDRSVASGLYLLRLRVGSSDVVRKALLIK